MTIPQYAPPPEALLDFLNTSIQQLSDAGLEARFIIMGPAAYDIFRKVLAASLKRGKGDFETYQYIPVVVDPFRKNELCVVPQPAGTDAGWEPFSVPG